MRKSNWLKPPKYYGGRSNKRVMRRFMMMLKGLAVFVHAKFDSERLKTLMYKIEFLLPNANGADISGVIISVFEDLIEVRDLDVDGSRSELDSAIKLLECDVEKMLACIKEGLLATPWTDVKDKRVINFLAKMETIKLLHKRVRDDYLRIKSVHENVLKELSAEHDLRNKGRLENKEVGHLPIAKCAVWRLKL